MRCLAIADACEKQGLYPVFVTAGGEAQELILTRGFPCLTLGTDYRDMEPELDRLSALLADGAPIVLDSYFVTERYMELLKENGHRVVWMDDLGGRAYPADMLINYNIYAEQLAYPAEGEAREEAQPHPSGKTNAGCVYLLGPDYAPVRPAFRREEDTVRDAIGTVLVTTGGADPYGAGVWFANLLTKLLPDARILVVCGPYAEGKEALYRLSGQNENVTVIEGCSDLSSLMHESDLAVAASGSTLYELCAARLPVILYYLADNQKRGAEAFARETGAVNLGDIRADCFQKEAAARMETALARLAAAPERKKLADAMYAFVDGNGAERIARRLSLERKK
ncbi:MAG: hypothetical protein NC254_13830 [bacterium]|nr:hypothetical protein [bacterium]